MVCVAHRREFPVARIAMQMITVKFECGAFHKMNESNTPSNQRRKQELISIFLVCSWKNTLPSLNVEKLRHYENSSHHRFCHPFDIIESQGTVLVDMRTLARSVRKMRQAMKFAPEESQTVRCI